jgi:periplasmic divalent cation tolerance protein
MEKKTQRTPFILVVTSTPDEQEARHIVHVLLEQRLIAAGKILRDVESRYWWQGKIEAAREYVVVLKTRQDRFKEIDETIHAIHSYSVPELIALPIVDGAPSYLTWLKDATNPDRH